MIFPSYCVEFPPRLDMSYGVGAFGGKADVVGSPRALYENRHRAILITFHIEAKKGFGRYSDEENEGDKVIKVNRSCGLFGRRLAAV